MSRFDKIMLCITIPIFIFLISRYCKLVSKADSELMNINYTQEEALQYYRDYEERSK